jgi:hypothetical protein
LGLQAAINAYIFLRMYCMGQTHTLFFPARFLLAGLLLRP